MEIKDYCSGDYLILCTCEGAAEEDIINWLLDEEKLLFCRDNLVGKKVKRTRAASKIESDYLSLDYDKPVIIFRIIDSKKEKFKLSNLYKERFGVVNYITNPEIEILMIIEKGEFHKYTTKFSDQKPSEYASIKYKIKKIKKSGTIKRFFGNDVDALIATIKEHKSKKGKGLNTLFDLLK